MVLRQRARLAQKRVAWSQKIPVVTLVERGGKARSVKVENVTAREVRRVVMENADTASHLRTDQANMYRRMVAHSRAMNQSITAETNGCAAMPIPRPSRAISAFSSAG